MRPFDWLVVVAYISWIVIDGLRRSKGTNRVDGYFLASRSLPWWAVGLSVMATQMSAVTICCTTGQGYASGLRFVQMYFGLPLAMVILSVTVVPFFTRARVYTAYEYLEQRFDVRVRSLASFLFLSGRALALGVTLSAPSVVMSAVLGWTLPVTVLAICVPMILYTTIGGVQAVAWTDVKQMFIVVGGMSLAVVVLLYGILQHVSFGQALELAGATGRLQSIDFSFNLSEKYTFWSGMIGGLFLMLSYFGCDQSQVQRYLTAKSINEARQSLMMSAYVKIPLQLLILVSGVLVFVFYIFETPPMLFNRA
jgi:SSS family transporter